MSAKKNADFNPFDNEFRFHQNFKLADYDTIGIECGYWNLTKSNDTLEIYYQFFLDENRIVAKGFNFTIDEIFMFDEDSLSNEIYITKLLEHHPIDFKSIKQRLAIFKIKDIKVLNSIDNMYMRIKLVDTNDTVYTAAIGTIFEENRITRQLAYFNGKSFDN